uniref:Uncharacterized protein n=1 Tax=Tanacetum cinerariifolium TaxID=118510 RepID=A0A6L2K4X8_TANCI|nr:hypothetical protein [Tanacetum cinerariifolium]
MEIRELSDDMAVFAKYLHKKGYLNNANFIRNNVFDASCFVNSYGRDFLKFAAERKFSSRDLWTKCQEYGRVIDAYIPNKARYAKGGNVGFETVYGFDGKKNGDGGQRKNKAYKKILDQLVVLDWTKAINSCHINSNLHFL